MTIPSRFFRFALSALVLGVFVSCSQKTPEEPFQQDRNVGGFRISRDESSNLPDSLTGWQLKWTAPADPAVISYYLYFSDIDATTREARFVNGSGPIDQSGLPRMVQLAPTDTAWQIPIWVFANKRGAAIPKDTTFRFYIWARYADGRPGAPVYDTVYFGDNIPPQVPSPILDTVGKTDVVFRFPRPLDQRSIFDTSMHGPISSIRLLWWEGRTDRDSTGAVKTRAVPADSLADTKIDAFRLAMAPLKFWTHYVAVLEFTDSAGNISRSGQFPILTHDSLAPAPPIDLRDSIGGNTLAITFRAATDTFDAAGNALRQWPNYHILAYRILLDGKPVDSIFLPAGSGGFGTGEEGKSGNAPDRFLWSAGRWTWIWPHLRPGQSFRLAIEAEDSSGNRAENMAVLSDSNPSWTSRSCDSGWVPVKGTGNLADYCIESQEHGRSHVAVSRVTWPEAIQACSSIGAELCSEAQWVRACETSPTSDQPFGYGALDIATGWESDSVGWLRDRCQLGTGDSVQAYDLTRLDPQCVSGWGVYDMPGRLGEWVRDVYTDSLPTDPSTIESGTLAYVGPSSLNGQSNLGTIHGGSALILDQPLQTLATARCRTRNYAVLPLLDTLPNGSIRQRPNPLGKSAGWGFRCCKLF